MIQECHLEPVVEVVSHKDSEPEPVYALAKGAGTVYASEKVASAALKYGESLCGP